eukprot:13570798-Alexandrium_andersonii.AAC.1
MEEHAANTIIDEKGKVPAQFESWQTIVDATSAKLREQRGDLAVDPVLCQTEAVLATAYETETRQQ